MNWIEPVFKFSVFFSYISKSLDSFTIKSDSGLRAEHFADKKIKIYSFVGTSAPKIIIMLNV